MAETTLHWNADEIQQARAFHAADPKRAAALALAHDLLQHGGQVPDETVQRARSTGWSDAELLEIVALVVANVLTNYVNGLAQTDLDFPPAAPFSGDS